MTTSKLRSRHSCRSVLRRRFHRLAREEPSADPSNAARNYRLAPVPFPTVIPALCGFPHPGKRSPGLPGNPDSL